MSLRSFDTATLGPQRAALEQQEGRLGDGIDGPARGECQQLAHLCGIPRHGGPDAAGVREIQQNRGREHPLTTALFEGGLRRRVVQK